MSPETYQQTTDLTQSIIGYIKPYPHTNPPANWLLCDGTKLEISDHPALFAVIGAQFGGDGHTAFQLPNLTGPHFFTICSEGYFPLAGVPLPDWQLADEVENIIQMRVLAFREAYAQGLDPFHRHPHDSQLDPDWLSMQVQAMNDAYARGDDPLHRHPHMSEIDRAWLERQVQAMNDAHSQGHDPFHKHPHVANLDPEWLEHQTQVLIDAYAQGRDPLHRHQHVSQLDPEWLERQAQVLHDAYAQDEDPLHRHLSVDHYDADWLDRQAQVLKDGYAQGRNPLHRHDHVDNLDPDWLKMQAQVLHDAYGQDEDPLHRHWPVDHLDSKWLESLAQSIFDTLKLPRDALAEPAEELQRIEGIGPKIVQVLQAAKITTFEQLAEAEVETLQQLLRRAGVRATPATWPEQAKLAAAGRWDELQQLQEQLMGGRRA